MTDNREPLLQTSQVGSADLDAAEAQTLADKTEAPASGGFFDGGGIAKPDHTTLGLASYAISSVFLAAMLSFAKFLNKREMPTFEILLARSSSILTIALLVCAKDRVNPFGHRRGLLALRGVFGFGAIACYFWAVKLLPLADAMVLTFLAPLWVALLGPSLIGEAPSKTVLIAIPACVAGVAFITQPSFLGFDKHATRNPWGVLFASGQALFSACAKMCVRELRKTETANVSVFYLSFCSTIGAICGCFGPKALGYAGSVRLPANHTEWLLLLGVGVTGYGTQICMTFALQNARAAPAIAMSYLSVVWSLLAGILLFHEIPNAMSLCGAGLICSCTLCLGIFEKQRKAPEGSAPETQPLTNGAHGSEEDNRHQL